MSQLIHIAVIGHVDHGKSTLVGRLLHETKALPEGKIREIELYCRNHSKPFEYAFLLDALKEERQKGITIDVSRAHFKLNAQEFVFIDCPGHEEFILNLITGAARADIAILCVDAVEGIKENSKRHIHLLSLLGIRKLIITINKMDAVGYSQSTFEAVADQLRRYLSAVKLETDWIIPVSAFYGDNLTQRSKSIPWYHSHSLVDAILANTLDLQKQDQATNSQESIQAFVQDVYKFTKNNDQRRIIAGHLESGKLSENQEIIFVPSLKKAQIKALINSNNSYVNTLHGPCPFGLILDEEINVDRGQAIVRSEKNSSLDYRKIIGRRLRVRFFWMSLHELQCGDQLILKVNSFVTKIFLDSIIQVVSSTSLEYQAHKNRVEGLSVAEAIIISEKPIYFDLNSNHETNRRFVLTKECQIQGGGQFLELLSEEVVEENKPAVFVKPQGQKIFPVFMARISQVTLCEFDVEIDLNQFNIYENSLADVINSFRILGYKVLLRTSDSNYSRHFEYLKKRSIPLEGDGETNFSYEGLAYHV